SLAVFFSGDASGRRWERRPSARGHDGTRSDRSSHPATAGGDGVCPRAVLGAGGAVHALASGCRQLAHLHDAGSRRALLPVVATILRNLVLGFVARGRRSARDDV
ncbi:unnamed protein product, partial [Phaeothamnion confervicola]